FKDHMGREVLEVNAGPGHTTTHLLDRHRLVVTDTDPVHVGTLHRRFGQLENIEAVQADFDTAALGSNGFDTAVLFDGLQRSPEPKQLLANIAASINSGGKILIQVPADPALFGPTDETAGHLRRFTKVDIEEVIRAAGLGVVMIEPFNRVGA